MENAATETPRWQQYELTRDWCVEYIGNRMKSLSRFPLPLGGGIPLNARLFGLTDRTCIAVFHHLAFSDPRVDLSCWRRLAAECCDLSVLFFCGEWREGFVEWDDAPRKDGLPHSPVDPANPWIKRGPLTLAEARRQLRWFDPLRYGLLWSLFFDRDDALAKLAQWPDTDLEYDEGLRDRTEEDCFFYILLCRELRGQGADPVSGQLAQRIRASRRRRPKMLLDVLEAVRARDQAALEKSITAWLRHFRKGEFRTNPIDETVSLDGTVLWHFARRAGLALPKLESNLMALVLRPESMT